MDASGRSGVLTHDSSGTGSTTASAYGLARGGPYMSVKDAMPSTIALGLAILGLVRSVAPSSGKQPGEGSRGSEGSEARTILSPSMSPANRRIDHGCR